MPWEITASGGTIPRRASGGSPVPVPRRVAEGTARTDAEGRFAISLVGPEVQEAPPWWNLRVDVRAADGEGVSVNRGISGWPASVTLALSGRTVYRKGEPVEIGLTRRSVSDGAPRPGKSTVTVQRLSRFEPDARDDSNPWAFAGEVATEKALERAAVAEDVRSDVVLCDAMGEGRVSLPLEPGFYRAVVTTLDAAGRRAEIRRAFVVDGPGLQSPVPLTFLVDAAETGPRRVFLKGSSGRAFADLVRESGPAETRSILGNGDSVVDLDVVSEEPVAVNGYAVRKGQWVSMNRSVPARPERLNIVLVSAFPTLEMRVTTARGEPLAGIALRAAAVPEDSEVREYDPHPGAWWPSRSVSLLRLGILAYPDGVPVRPEASSEWYSVNVPVAPAERALLHEEHYSFECGTSMIQVRPSLPREDRPSYGFQRASVVDARRDAPAELWAPGLVTDERGIASVPFLPRPGTAYRMTATAIAKDGRTGFFSGRVVASTPATEETK
ncbi:MAG: hypothetical protein JNK60_09535 [Acidobacteria bacterium]|nr:hypothetical protein [Acidobacteriota bacterium]